MYRVPKKPSSRYIEIEEEPINGNLQKLYEIYPLIREAIANGDYAGNDGPSMIISFINNTTYLPLEARVPYSKLNCVYRELPEDLTATHGNTWSNILGKPPDYVRTIDVDNCLYIGNVSAPEGYGSEYNTYKFICGQLVPTRCDLPKLTKSVLKILQRDFIPGFVFEFFERYYDLSPIESITGTVKPFWMYLEKFCSDKSMCSDKLFILRETRLHALEEWHRLKYACIRDLLNLEIVEKLIVYLMYSRSIPRSLRPHNYNSRTLLGDVSKFAYGTPNILPYMKKIVKSHCTRHPNFKYSTGREDPREHFFVGLIHKVQIFKHVAVETDLQGMRVLNYLYNPTYRFFNDYFRDMVFMRLDGVPLCEISKRISSKLQYPKDYFFEFDKEGCGPDVLGIADRYAVGPRIMSRNRKFVLLTKVISDPEILPEAPLTNYPLSLMMSMLEYINCFV